VIARRSSLDDGPIANLRRLLSDRFVDRLWMVTIKDEDVDGKSFIKRYYPTKRPDVNGDHYQFSFIVSFEGKESPRTFHKDRITYLGLSPQSKVASQFKPILADDTKLAQWETVIIDLANAIRHESDIDPILQVALLRKVVGAAMEGSEPLREALQIVKTQLDDPNVDVNVPWMNPEAPLFTANRVEAAQLIQSLPDFGPARQKALAQRNRVERDIARCYRTVGWLLRSADGWQVRSRPAVRPPGDLFVLVMTDDQRVDWRKVGEIIAGEPKIDSRESSSLAEGRPVFVITDKF
jgi:hypothetical protein